MANSQIPNLPAATALTGGGVGRDRSGWRDRPLHDPADCQLGAVDGGAERHDDAEECPVNGVRAACV